MPLLTELMINRLIIIHGVYDFYLSAFERMRTVCLSSYLRCRIGVDI